MYILSDIHEHTANKIGSAAENIMLDVRSRIRYRDGRSSKLLQPKRAFALPAIGCLGLARFTSRGHLTLDDLLQGLPAHRRMIRV
jgi:hypothetical protein